jgi:hypothetical protein
MEKQRLGVGQFVGFLGVTLGFEPQLGYNLYNYGEISLFSSGIAPPSKNDWRSVRNSSAILQYYYSTEIAADLCKLTTFLWKYTAFTLHSHSCIILHPHLHYRT